MLTSDEVLIWKCIWITFIHGLHTFLQKTDLSELYMFDVSSLPYLDPQESSPQLPSLLLQDPF
jgi:hypothetical protein